MRVREIHRGEQLRQNGEPFWLQPQRIANPIRFQRTFFAS